MPLISTVSSRFLAADQQAMDAGPDRCPDEWTGDVNPQVRPAAAPEQDRSKGGAKANGRIEGTSRNRPSSKNGGQMVKPMARP